MKRILPFLFLALAVLGVYAPTLGNGFVWDDTALIFRDPFIRSWRLIPEGFQHFLFTDAAASDFYRPIQRLLYTCEYAAFGFRPAGYHLVSVLCHLAAAIALLFLARELLRLCGADDRTRLIAPVLAALIWAMHPLQSSAVAYVSGCADPLAAAFGFAGLCLGLRGLRSFNAGHWAFMAGAAVLFLLSALSKEAGLVFLALWLAIIIVHKTVGLREAGIVGFVLVSYFSLRLPAEHIAPPERAPISALVRPILCARALAEYTGLVLLPVNLRMEREVETRPTGFGNDSLTSAAWRELQTLAGVLLLAGFVYWLLRERKRDRAIFLALILALIAYLPVSGVVRLNATVAEHWLYLPSAFLFLGALLGGMRLVETRGAAARKIALPLLALWMGFLGGRTFLRTFDWKDQRTFLERTIASGGDSARILINLAGLEMNERQLNEAKQHLQAALQKEPDQPLAVINLAAVALKQNDYQAAHELLARASAMPLVEAQACEMLAVLENKETGRANLLRLRQAARTGPPDWAIEKRYVKVLSETGANDIAMRELEHCLATQWYRADSWQLLSELATVAGRPSEADAAQARARAYDVRLGRPEAAL